MIRRGLAHSPMNSDLHCSRSFPRYTYSSRALGHWFRRCQLNHRPFSSPLTRKPLAVKGVTPNRALRDAMDEFQKVRKNSIGGESTEEEVGFRFCSRRHGGGGRQLSGSSTEMVNSSTEERGGESSTEEET